MSKDKKTTLSFVGDDRGIESIVKGHKEQILSSITQYGFARDSSGNANPKMAMTFLERIAREVEEHFAEATKTYVRTRLNQQVARYNKLGWVKGAGYTEESFSDALMPLHSRVMNFFAPPGEHLVVDGEYTLLLILPEAWVPKRRVLASLLGEDFTTEVDLTTVSSRTNGKVLCDKPYVLVGINGGRELRDNSLQESDSMIYESGRSYFSLHELCQLFLMRPHFLRAPSGDIHEQSEALALGDKCSRGLLRLSATATGIRLETSDTKNVHGGVGIGKPYYTKIITE